MATIMAAGTQQTPSRRADDAYRAGCEAERIRNTERMVSETQDEIAVLVKVVKDGNGQPGLVTRMDRVERSLQLIARIVAAIGVPILLSLIGFVGVLLWAFITGAAIWVNQVP